MFVEDRIGFVAESIPDASLYRGAISYDFRYSEPDQLTLRVEDLNVLPFFYALYLRREHVFYFYKLDPENAEKSFTDLKDLGEFRDEVLWHRNRDIQERRLNPEIYGGNFLDSLIVRTTAEHTARRVSATFGSLSAYCTFVQELIDPDDVKSLAAIRAMEEADTYTYANLHVDERRYPRVHCPDMDESELAALVPSKYISRAKGFDQEIPNCSYPIKRRKILLAQRDILKREGMLVR